MRTAGTRFGAGALQVCCAGVLFALLLVAPACAGGQTGSEISARSSGDPQPAFPPAGMGSIAGCIADRDCAERAEKVVAWLRVPRATPRLVAAGCETGPECSPACMCWIGREGESSDVASSFADQPCQAVGLGDACLWLDRSPCTPGPCACAAECSQLVARLAAEELAGLQASLHVASCLPGKCNIAFKIGERCYTGERASQRVEVDCATLAPIGTTTRLSTTGGAGSGSESALLGCGADGSVVEPSLPGSGLAACLDADAAGSGEPRDAQP